MSKKLIAVSAAAALALTGLVGIAPANATAPAVTFTTVDGSTSSSTAGTEAAPMRQNVPDMNTLAGNESATLDFTNIAAGDVLTVTTSGKVRITTDKTVGSADVDVTKIGTQSFTRTFTTQPSVGQAGGFEVYASVTDEVTTEIKWQVVRTGSTTSGSLWIKGRAGQAYAMTDIVAPATLATGASTEVRFKVRDVFGNQLKTATITGGVKGAANTVDAVWDATNSWHDATVTSNTNRVFVLTIDGDNDLSITDVAGFADESVTSLHIVNGAASATASAQVALLVAQLAALQIIKDRKVSKLKYNRLARKWNAAFPSQKVWVKP
jgi:hypothetical protein